MGKILILDYMGRRELSFLKSFREIVRLELININSREILVCLLEEMN